MRTLVSAHLFLDGPIVGALQQRRNSLSFIRRCTLVSFSVGVLSDRSVLLLVGESDISVNLADRCLVLEDEVAALRRPGFPCLYHLKRSVNVKKNKTKKY